MDRERAGKVDEVAHLDLEARDGVPICCVFICMRGHESLH